MSELIDLMLKYPSVIPIDGSSNRRRTFKGYLPVHGIDYQLNITLEDGQPTVEITPQLQPFEQEISNIKSSNIVAILNNLKDIIASKADSGSFKNLTDVYKFILSEYVELREFYINMHRCTIAHDLSEIRISYMDESDRVHDLVVETDMQKAHAVFKVARHSLPEQKEMELFQANNSLKAVYERFVTAVGKLQHFFDAMDSLDASCWVMDPEQPSRKERYRRVSLDHNASVIVTVDPWNDTSIPNLKFLGPDRAVDGFRQKVADNLVNWRPGGDVVQELLKLLELSRFPTRPVETRTNEMLLCQAGECCICFSMRLNDKLPEIVCQNKSCEQFFHRECLYQWLVSVNAKQSFNELNGQCPNCEKHISCPL